MNHRTNPSRNRSARFRPEVLSLEDRVVPAAVPPPLGIISWWTGDNTAADLMMRNHGELLNGADFAPGEVDAGFTFDGIDDVVRAPATTGLPVGDADRTIELWARVDQYTANDGSLLASYGTPGNYGQVYSLGLEADGRSYVSTWGVAVFGPVLETGRWYHVAATNKGRSFKLYVDGSQVAAGELDVDTPSGSDFKIGRQLGGNLRRLNGMVDEVTVYNRALGAEEIESIHQAGANGKIKDLMVVTTTNPDMNSVVSAVPTTFTLNFNHPYNPDSVQASDFQVNGTAATSVTLTDVDTVTFTFASKPTTANGEYSMHVDAGAVTRASDGLGLMEYDGSFHVATKFYVVNDSATDQTYEYGDSGDSAENYALGGANSAPRGAASTAAGDKVWVVDANKNVYVYNPSGGLLGSWTAGSLNAQAQVEGIATNGTDVWIVDAKQDKVFRYTGAASRLSGSQNAASSFSLNTGNKDPKDIVTDGTSLWVVNASTTDKVFKYSLTGSLQGSWTLSTSGATSPTGITLDPGDPNHLWIVDNGTDRVYQYDGATTRTSGSQAASTSFALAAGNGNPQGIADPPVARTTTGRLPKVKAPKHDVATIDALFAMDALGRKRARKLLV